MLERRVYALMEYALTSCLEIYFTKKITTDKGEEEMFMHENLHAKCRLQ
jgi:hypothetical protein